MKSRGGSSLVAALAICGALFALPAMASAGSISGTVTAANGGAPIGGIEVCPLPPITAPEATCTETNAGGGYELTGLRADSYSIHFSGDRNNLPYVNEFYDNEEAFPGDLITIGEAENRAGVDARLRDGGAISGTVTDANSHLPVASLPVCAFAQVPSGEVGRCSRTDGSGNYMIRGLPSEEYEVAFEGEGEFNYLTQYWQESETYGAFDPILVTEPATVTGVDAALRPGAEISGRLTEAGTGRPLAKVDVSLLSPYNAEEIRTVKTDGAGNYAFRGRPAGTYVVAFSHTLGGPWNNDCYAAQYYKGSSTFAGASPLTVATPQTLTGIDGEVADLCPPPAGPEPVKVTLIPTPPKSPPWSPIRCAKGKKKKYVKGRVRCVKKPKKHRGHRRGGHGPRAVATER